MVCLKWFRDHQFPKLLRGTKKEKKTWTCGWRYTPTTINWKELSFQLFDLNFLLGGSFLEPRKDEPINKKMPTYLDMTTFNVHQVEEKSQKLYKTLRVCLCVDPVFFFFLFLPRKYHKIKTTPNSFSNRGEQRTDSPLPTPFYLVICVIA